MARSILALSLLTLATAASAGRTIELIENGLEVALGNVTLPGSAAGTVIVEPCETCDPQSLRVSADTRYFVGGTELTLSDFHLAADRILGSDDGGASTLVGVYYGRETGTVTRIRIFANGG